MQRSDVPPSPLAAAGALGAVGVHRRSDDARRRDDADARARARRSRRARRWRARRGRRDHDRHEVRPAAVRPDGPSRQPEGFDVEIGKIIAAEARHRRGRHRVEGAVSANREPFIQNGEVDLVVATYTINDKRKEVVSFAGPYYQAGQSILVLADNEDIKGEEDLAGKPVCSVRARRPPRSIAERRRAGR